MLKTKEFQEIMAQFEKDMKYGDFSKADKEWWTRKEYYNNGEINKMFKMYLTGYSFGKSVGQAG